VKDLTKVFLTEMQAAALLDVKPSTLSNWRHRRKGPAFLKRGNRVRYKKRVLLYFRKKLQEQRSNAGSNPDLPSPRSQPSRRRGSR
jgi:hypothetical protein